jgi:hypothetical protein
MDYEFKNAEECKNFETLRVYLGDIEKNLSMPAFKDSVPLEVIASLDALHARHLLPLFCKVACLRYLIGVIRQKTLPEVCGPYARGDALARVMSCEAEFFTICHLLFVKGSEVVYKARTSGLERSLTRVWIAMFPLVHLVVREKVAPTHGFVGDGEMGYKSDNNKVESSRDVKSVWGYGSLDTLADIFRDA